LALADAELGNCKAADPPNQACGGGAAILLSHKIWAKEMR